MVAHRNDVVFLSLLPLIEWHHHKSVNGFRAWNIDANAILQSRFSKYQNKTIQKLLEQLRKK